MNRRTLLRAVAATPIVILAAPLLPKYATGGVIPRPVVGVGQYQCFENLGIRWEYLVAQPRSFSAQEIASFYRVPSHFFVGYEPGEAA